MAKGEEAIKIISGGCGCGAIEYRVKLPVKWCAHCHCEDCRCAQAAPFVTWYGVDLKQFKIAKGKPFLKWHKSSQSARRGFCRRCGTPLFFDGKNWPDEIHITRESTREDIGALPKLHVFYDRHVSYLTFDDGLDKYGGADGFTLLDGEK